MKTSMGILAAVVLMSAPAFADVTKEDLKKLAAAGVSDGVVIAYVRSHGPMPRMSAQDLIDLKNAGVSDKVLEQIARAEPAPKSEAPAMPVRTEVVERRVHVAPPPAVACAPSVWYSPWRPWRPCRPWVRIGFCW